MAWGEFGYLSGVVPGTPAALKALVLDLNKKIKSLEIYDVNGGSLKLTSDPAGMVGCPINFYDENGNWFYINYVGGGLVFYNALPEDKAYFTLGGVTGNITLHRDTVFDPTAGLYVSDGMFVIGSTAILATGAELNNVADVSGRVQEMTASDEVGAGIQSVELNHATEIVGAIIPDAVNHQGIFIVKNTSSSGTVAHTLTLISGTFDGTNTIATLNAPGEALAVYFDSAGNGIILANIGGVVLS